MKLECGRVAQWITRLTTDQKIPGSNPGVVVVFLSRCWSTTFLCHILFILMERLR